MAGTMEWAGAGIVAFASALSAWSYRRDHRRLREQQDERHRIESPREFAAVYAWIRWTTLWLGIGALLLESPVLLVVYRQPWSLAVGMAMVLLGLLLFGFSRRALGEHYSPCFDSRLPRAIVTTGPYARIRHPIYSANQLLLLGIAIMTGSLWCVFNLLLLCHYYRRSAVAEELQLACEHAGYAAYLGKTGRFLPRLRGLGTSGASRGSTAARSGSADAQFPAAARRNAAGRGCRGVGHE